MASKFDWNPEIAMKEIGFLDSKKLEEKVPSYKLSLAQRHQDNDWKKVLENTAQFMQKLGDKNHLDKLDKIDITVQIALGDRDNMVSLRETVDVYRSLKNANFLVIPNTAHPIEKFNFNRLQIELELFFN